MRKVNNKEVVVFTIFMILCLSIFVSYKIYQNKQKELYENQKNLRNNQERKQFAIFIKNENNQYETYDGDDFPEGYIANLDKSICTDINGNVIKDVISNSDQGITVTSNKTIYCELYLEKKPITGGSMVENPIDGVLESTGVAEDELAVRYYGTNPANYICFGTNDKDTCVNDTDKYMYRIIGITKDTNKMKVIKKEALNTAYAWHSSANNTTWDGAALKPNLNGSYFLTNSTYKLTEATPFDSSKKWADLIETIAWKYGDLTDHNQAASAILQTEQAWTTTTSAQIGLMYVADYYYAYQKAGLNCNSSYSTCVNSWMHLSKNDTSAPNSYEWTMSRYGYDGYYYRAWIVHSNGTVYSPTLNNTNSVRPVFYLKPDVSITGSGTESDPYLIING